MTKYILNRMGFRFSPEEENILIKVFSTGGSVDSGEELALLYRALLNLARQAKKCSWNLPKKSGLCVKNVFWKKCRMRLGYGIGKAIDIVWFVNKFEER